MVKSLKIGIVNGPNLNLLGKREPSVYGIKSFEEYFEELKNRFQEHELLYFQSNSEGAILDCIQQWGFVLDGIVINAGAYTHTSIAIADGIRAITTPTIEVHISNVFQREAFRHHSYLSAVCKGGIFGMGLEGYALAIQAFINGHS